MSEGSDLTTWDKSRIPTLGYSSQFIIIEDPNEHEGQVTSINEAKSYWTIYPDFVYNTRYRVAGFPEVILPLVKNVEDPKTNITVDNYLSSLTYKKEMNRFRELRHALYQGLWETPGANLLDLVEKKVQPTKSNLVVGRSRPLQGWIDKLKPGDIVDVSNMTSSGAKVKYRPIDRLEYATKSLYGYFGKDDYDPMIVSNNLTNYLRALEFLGIDKYEKQAQAARDFFEPKKIKKKKK